MINGRINVGAYEAKTRFPELLRGVKNGQEYVITHRGNAIADLIPAKEEKHKDTKAAVAQIKMFMQKNRVEGVNIKALIEEGRA